MTSAAGTDLGNLGAPGSRSYQNGELGAVQVPVVAGIGTFTVAIPRDPSFAGMEVFAQAFALTNHNALHLSTSNGFVGRIGL
jgi:hypothetical protein